jgi:hypothetical protein
VRWLLAAVFATLAIPALAAGPHDMVRPSLIHLELTYEPTVGVIGVPKQAQATGFFVSGDGFILTSYHLLDTFETDKGVNLSVMATVGGPGAPFKFEASVVNALPPLDLLLLKIRPSDVIEFVPVRLGRTELITDDRVFASGYHGTDPFSLEGPIANRLGPAGVGYLWALQMQVAAGQSGSPVYLGDGTVVGMLKGNNSSAAHIGYMIPIEYADALIAHLRMSEMARKIARLEASMRDVGAYYLWSGTANNGRIVIRYEKLIAGDPHVHEVAYSVVPYLTEDGETKRDRAIDEKTLPVQHTANGKGGEIAIENIQSIINDRLSTSPTVTGVPRLDVRITPITSDGTKLPTARVPIEWPEQ